MLTRKLPWLPALVLGPKRVWGNDLRLLLNFLWQKTQGRVVGYEQRRGILQRLLDRRYSQPRPIGDTARAFGKSGGTKVILKSRRHVLATGNGPPYRRHGQRGSGEGRAKAVKRCL